MIAKTNILFVMWFGRTIVRAILFPYGNKMVTRVLDNQMNERFGNEFAKILDRTHMYVKDYMLESGAPNLQEGNEAKALAVNQGRR